jgi:hypothetical protein
MGRYSREEWLGTATIMPVEPMPAGEYGTWTIHYSVGVAGIDDGGRVRIAFRSVCDWGTPQFAHPSQPNYVSLRSTRRVLLTPDFGTDGIRPWTRTLTVRVSGDALGQGDQLTIVLGDRGYGSLGMRAQTYPEPRFRVKFQADPFGTGLYEEVAELGFPIVGGHATQLVVTAPSDVAVGEPSWLQVRSLDPWGNPDPAYRGTVRLTGDLPDGCPGEYTFDEADSGVRRFDGLRFRGSGVLRVSAADDERGLSATSNPVRCQDAPPARRLYWADLHGQTEETVGSGSIPDYFRYARDIASMDVTAHSGNDFQITNSVYEQLRQNAESFYEPGRFVTFHGYEWSGNTPAGGDHNVYYLGDGPIRRSSHTQIDDRSDADTDCYPVDRLYAANAGRDDVIITPHIGGRRASLEYHDPALEPAIEIASQWGRFEWFAHEALRRGMRVALIGGSDDHSGRPGWSTATLAHHGTRGGLTAFLADELTREGIWDAFRSRRCYGTTGPRIVLDVSVNGHPIGSEPVLSETPVLTARVLGTAPIDTVSVRRGTATVHTYSALPEPEPDGPYRVRVAWRGARSRGRVRPLDWTGGLTVWGGRIVAAENYAIDNLLDGVTGWNAEHVSWRSHTCGDWDGVIVEVEGDGDTRLDFASPTLHFSFRLADLESGPLRQIGPYLEHQLEVRRLARQEGPREVSVEWRDELPVPGVNPYWIWVTQADGEMAWSTPVYASWQR